MVTLYRPVGFKEMELILNTGSRRYPPRLSMQPIFYPVLNYKYAEEIAKKWNTEDANSGYVGYVTEFEIDKEYYNTHEEHTVGASYHKELWILADKLDEFNEHVMGNIRIKNAFYGKCYAGVSSVKTQLFNKCYIEQLTQLNSAKDFNPIDFVGEILAQWRIIHMNYLLWKNTDFSDYKIDTKSKEVLLEQIREILTRNHKWFLNVG